MKVKKSRLLERQLTRRMIQVQLVALGLFFFVGVVPFTIFPALDYIGNAHPLDPAATMIFAKSLEPDGLGDLKVTQTKELTELVRDYPDIWFYARTAGGANASEGVIPAPYREIERTMWYVDSMEIRLAHDVEGSSVLMRPEQSAAGPVMVMTGAGPVLGLAALVRKLSATLALATIAVLILASVIAIPRVVRREMRGIQTAADQARLIDINTRGTRLPTANVPEEVGALVKAVNDALARLDESYARRERFLADSAHELRTPIAILQTRLETADPFPEQARLLIDVARLSGLAGQLLDLQRMDFDQTRFSPVDIADLAGVVVGELAPLAIVAGYDLSLNAPHAPVMVNGDGSGLARSLTNLIQNAIAYGGQKGEITVEVTRQGTILVCDEGSGIPENERDRVFEPFYRIKPSARGAGLGLNLVETMIRYHHGHVSISDAPSGGTCVTISLPLLTPAPPRIAPKTV